MSEFRPDRRTTTERGYGHQHQLARARLAPLVAAGQAVCTRCHQPIQPGEPWHLDHRDDRLGYMGPAHASCNSTAPHRRQGEQIGERRVSRDW